MIQTAHPGTVEGTIRIPASKSHTIRALLISTLAEGDSRLVSPLDSADTRACVEACKQFGAKINKNRDTWTVTGVGSTPGVPEDVIDVGNSGTTLYLATGIAALQKDLVVFTGDSQIRSRPVGPLLDSLRDLGARAESTRNNGCAPYIIGGGLAGGKTQIESQTSQWLSALLLSAPLAKNKSSIDVPLLNERPYVDITLHWLQKQEIQFRNDNYQQFSIEGAQKYTRFEEHIPGDFSSATFFLCAAAMTRSRIRIEGLNMEDPQGDKAVLAMLERMGCVISYDTAGDVPAIEVIGGDLSGVEIDMNATPDALPALAVVACFAEGETRLINVPQARLKETDRISVMCGELRKLGADIEELPDGLIVSGDPEKPFAGGRVDGHDDHRVVMALAIAALRSQKPIEIETAEAAAVTFPTFFELLEAVRRP